MYNRKINMVEFIPYTIQGEGRFSGLPCSLLRLSGCNLNCSFCDTEWKEGEDIEISEAINKLPNNHVLITGGEPTIHPNFEILINRLIMEQKVIFVETNGLVWKSDWVNYPINWSVSPKLSSSGHKFTSKHIKSLNWFIENMKVGTIGLKFVMSKTYVSDMLEIDEIIDGLSAISLERISALHLQPVDNDPDIFKGMVLTGPKTGRYRYTIQSHKVMGVK